MYILFSIRFFIFIYDIISFTGGRDNEGRVIITFPARPRGTQYDHTQLLQTIQYLSIVPRYVVYRTRWFTGEEFILANDHFAIIKSRSINRLVRYTCTVYMHYTMHCL